MFVNLTPHALNVLKADGTFLELPPSGTVARRSVERVVVGEVDGITVYATKFGQLEGLPEPTKDTIYIVSALAAQACADRNDVLVPGEAIRDEAGRVIGCDGLCRPVVPVVRGEWKLYGNDDDSGMSYWCTVCNFQLSEDLFYSGYNGRWIENGVFKYCPNCGAKMEVEP
jgi:hypothetical protein